MSRKPAGIPPIFGTVVAKVAAAVPVPSVASGTQNLAGTAPALALGGGSTHVIYC